jgi:hypothetical protein
MSVGFIAKKQALSLTTAETEHWYAALRAFIWVFVIIPTT